MSLSIAERQLVELRIRNDGPNIAVAYVLWAVLGLPVSAHRFYLGRPRSAIYQIISVFLLVGIFWWLLDAALISGIIRDQKETMRRDLIREIEDGRETQDVPAPRRFEADPQPRPAAPVAASPFEPETSPPAVIEPPAPAPEVVTTRSKPQPFGLQSLGDAPVSPAPAVEPVEARPAPQPFGLQSIGGPPVAPPPEPVIETSDPVAEPIEARPFGVRPAVDTPNLAPAPAPAPEVFPPRIEPQPFGLRLVSEEPAPPPIAAVPASVAAEPAEPPKPAPLEPDRPASESPFRFHPES
jgi:hypothetical protein